MTIYCLALPYIPGGLELAKKFAADECGHGKEHDEFYKIAGVKRENTWIQRSPHGSNAPDIEIASLETDDPAKTLHAFATSTHPWAVRFRDYAIKAYGIDFSKPLPPLNESIIDWQE
jgi:hypothetical protein